MLFDSVSCEMEKVKDSKDIKPQEIANVLYSFATSQRSNDELFEAFSLPLLRLFGENDSLTEPQHFSNVIWSYATAQERGARQAEFISLLADAMESRPGFASRFNGQALANTAWGLAKLLVQSERQNDHHQNPNDGSAGRQNQHLVVVRILRQVAMAMIDRPGDFRPQHVSNSVWAMATMGFGVGEDARQGVREINGAPLLQTDNIESDRKLMMAVLHSVAKSSIPRLSRFSSQGLSNLAWSFAKLGHCHPELFHEISIALAAQRQPPNGQDIANTLWAFATVGYHDEDAFERTLSRVNRRTINTMQLQEISNVFWAIGTAGIKSDFTDAFNTQRSSPKKQPSN